MIDSSPHAARLAELLATFSIAADAGMGMPLDHALRCALAASRLGELAGASAQERRDAFYLSLLRYAGCTSDSHVAAEVMGDEVALRGALYGVDWGTPAEVIGRIADSFRAPKSLRGAAKLARTVAKMPKLFDTARAHCEVGDQLAARLGFGEEFRRALFQTFERWDGRGWPAKLRGEAIHPAMRLAHAAEEVEIAHRLGGRDAIAARIEARARKSIDPRLARHVLEHLDELSLALEAPSPWTAALEAEPAPHPSISDAQLDEGLRAIADFADLKSRYTRAHSRGVAVLAREAAQLLQLDPRAQTHLERAAWLHDLGRVAVSATVWDKPGPLTDGERERVRMHTYVGERILARFESLRPALELASAAHERVDGSGYHRKLNGASIPIAARLLAAADVYRALIEDRAYRPAKTPDEAAAVLEEMARSGSLAPDAAAAILRAAGHERKKRNLERPAGLSDRELEVLRLVARGLTNKEVAAALNISTRTAGHHLEHIFAKIGVTTRAAATLFAVENGLFR